MEFIERRIRMIAEPIFWKYLIFDDEGEMAGIKEDAPEDAKKEYEAFIDAERDLKEQGIKL